VIWDTALGANPRKPADVHVPAVSFGSTCVVRAISRFTRVAHVAPMPGALCFLGEVKTAYGAAAIEEKLDQLLPEWLARIRTTHEPITFDSAGFRFLLRRFENCSKALAWTFAELDAPAPEVSEGGPAASLREKDELDKAIRNWTATLPNDYHGRRQALVDGYLLFRQRVCAAFESVLNEELVKTPQATPEEKRLLGRRATAAARDVGCIFKCPKTGSPAYLSGKSGGRPGVGRFHLEVIDENGHAWRTVTSSTLPYLTLIPQPSASATKRERESPDR
jgi:hypothetical protein